MFLFFVFRSKSHIIIKLSKLSFCLSYREKNNWIRRLTSQSKTKIGRFMKTHLNLIFGYLVKIKDQLILFECSVKLWILKLWTNILSKWFQTALLYKSQFSYSMLYSLRIAQQKRMIDCWSKQWHRHWKCTASQYISLQWRHEGYKII